MHCYRLYSYVCLVVLLLSMPFCSDNCDSPTEPQVERQVPTEDYVPSDIGDDDGETEEVPTYELPIPKDDPLYMIGMYSPFHIDYDAALLASLPTYHINGIRIFTGNAWGGWTLYTGRDLNIDKDKFVEIRSFVQRCNSLGLIIQVVMFNRSNIQTAWHWDLDWYYHKDNWTKHEELANEFIKALDGCHVIYDIDNEGMGGYDFVKFIYDILYNNGIPRKYISTSTLRKDAFASIDGLVGLMGIHGAYTSRFWSMSYGGLHYIYSSDGRMEGSSGIYQFNMQKWGAYPTVDEMEAWVKEVRRRDANFEFNFSGIFEVNAGTLSPHGIKLLKAIKRGIEAEI